MKSVLFAFLSFFSLPIARADGEACDVTPFKNQVLTEQREVWRKFYAYAAKRKGFEISTYSDEAVTLSDLPGELEFEYAPTFTTASGAKLILVTHWARSEGDWTTTTRSFSIRGFSREIYTPDGTLKDRICESSMGHKNPSYLMNYVDYYLVNKATGVIVAELGDYVPYFYCMSKEYPESMCDSDAVHPPIEYKLMHYFRSATHHEYSLLR